MALSLDHRAQHGSALLQQHFRLLELHPEESLVLWAWRAISLDGSLESCHLTVQRRQAAANLNLTVLQLFTGSIPPSTSNQPFELLEQVFFGRGELRPELDLCSLFARRLK